MIYVILESRLSPDITKEDIIGCKELNLSFELCIKIGFSIDFKNRLSQYTSDTPRFDILYTYEEGTEDDEKRLHKYFEKYKTSDLNGKEWFKFDKEFIDFFNNNPTIEDIRSKISHIKLPKEIKEEQRNKLRAEKIILPFVYLQLELGINNDTVSYGDIDYLDESFQEVIKSDILFNYYLEKIKPRTNVEFLEFLKSELPEDDYNHLFESYNKQLEQNIDITSELAAFNSISFYDDKMRYICDQEQILPNNKFKLLLDFVPRSFKNYFTVLGPAKCKAHKYRQIDMEREYQRLLNNQGVSLDDRIYDTFHAGDKLSNAEIKKRLEKIYQDSGYQQTAKATDLNQWFDIKNIQIRIKGTKLKENGLLLISRTIPPTP